MSAEYFRYFFLIVGPGDVVAEYYQQQIEMLEGFNEMDTLADRGFLPGMSKVAMLVTLFGPLRGMTLKFKFSIYLKQDLY